MTSEDIVGTLKVDMQDAADQAELEQFMRDIATVTRILAGRHKFAPDMAAYALACVACAVADSTGNRQPVMCALADTWPEIFHEISEEEFHQLYREVQPKRP